MSTHTRALVFFFRPGPIARIKSADLAGAAARRRQTPRLRADWANARLYLFRTQRVSILIAIAMQARISLTGLQQNRRLLLIQHAARFLPCRAQLKSTALLSLATNKRRPLRIWLTHADNRAQIRTAHTFANVCVYIIAVNMFWVRGHFSGEQFLYSTSCVPYSRGKKVGSLVDGCRL